MLPIYQIIRTCQMVIYNHKGGIYLLKKVKEILDKRSKINDEDDYRIEKCRDELIDALSQDELLTIDILNYGCL